MDDQLGDNMDLSEMSVAFLDHLITKHEHWIMKHGELDPRIQEFVSWCIEEERIAMQSFAKRRDSRTVKATK